MSPVLPGTQMLQDWTRYCGDAAWRTVAAMDTLRERATNMSEHEAAGMPPLLHFEAEEVADAHAFVPPCNYRLLRITRCGTDALERFVRRDTAPVIVVDPRAGHGPGIGGFRRDSEVGMALREGHPVYFVVFDPEPVENQTMGAVVEAIASFIALVARRHRGRQPIVYGNCQGGWAVILALSHCQRRAGLAVLNGSPLSYWAGAAGVNPMRLAGGLAGGVWPAHLLADLGAGRFDGAWLVQNFENLKPEGSWQKYDALWARPEREHDRFLAFERWWNGFYFLGREEILSAVRDLFIGNKLERGEIVVDGHCRADLRRVTTPLVIFSSFGDNITPPHQALGWLRAIHSSTSDLVAAGQTVVYLLDPRVGHLGIFVSADVATRQHRAILHHAAAIQALPPGLYEMVLEDMVQETPQARFEPRALEDISVDPHPAGFQQVQELSEAADWIYASFASPLVRLFASPESARLMAHWHPMRANCRWWSDQENPAAAALPAAREAASAAALPESERQHNTFFQAERAAAEMVYQALLAWRQCRDTGSELAFQLLHGAAVTDELRKTASATAAPACLSRQGRCSRSQAD